MNLTDEEIASICEANKGDVLLTCRAVIAAEHEMLRKQERQQ